MCLKEKQAAGLLHVFEKTVYCRIALNISPLDRIGSRQWFNRAEFPGGTNHESIAEEVLREAHTLDRQLGETSFQGRTPTLCR